MNYKKIYDDIIIKAKKENRARGNVYYESHHILPRSMGGDNSKENLVLLTGREHFICHYLLTKFITGSDKYKLSLAFMSMKRSSDNQIRYFNSVLYESKRKEVSEAQRYNQKGSKNSQAGRHWMCYHDIIIRCNKNEMIYYFIDGYQNGKKWKTFKKKKVNKTSMKRNI